MKRFVVLCIFVVTVVCGGAAFAQEGLTKIADNVYSYVGARTPHLPTALPPLRAATCKNSDGAQPQ